MRNDGEKTDPAQDPAGLRNLLSRATDKSGASNKDGSESAKSGEDVDQTASSQGTGNRRRALADSDNDNKQADSDDGASQVATND